MSLPFAGASVHNPRVLGSLFMGQTAAAVTDALRSATGGAGAIGVIRQVRLGRVLSDRGHAVIQIVDGQKGRARAGENRVQGRPDALPMGDGELAAVVGLGMAQRGDWENVLREWRRVVMEGGIVIAVDRAPPVELTRRLLCAGLTAIEQRRARGQIITSGRVLRLESISKPLRAARWQGVTSTGAERTRGT